MMSYRIAALFVAVIAFFTYGTQEKQETFLRQLQGDVQFSGYIENDAFYSTFNDNSYYNSEAWEDFNDAAGTAIAVIIFVWIMIPICCLCGIGWGIWGCVTGCGGRCGEKKKKKEKEVTTVVVQQ